MTTFAENRARFQAQLRPHIPKLYRALLELAASPNRRVKARAVRMLAATGPDLNRLLAEGGFSEADMADFRELRGRVAAGEFGPA